MTRAKRAKVTKELAELRRQIDAVLEALAATERLGLGLGLIPEAVHDLEYLRWLSERALRRLGHQTARPPE